MKMPVLSSAATTIAARWNAATVRSLKKAVGVAEVFVRGSVARGDSVPFRSDLDLVLLLEGDAASSFDAMKTIHKALETARRTNPSLRDWWQHLISVDEWPVIERFASVCGAAGWRTIDGRAAIPSAPKCDERLERAAVWAQLCLWSGSVFHPVLHASGGVHSFGAGVKKSAAFASRLGITVDVSGDRTARTIAVFRALEKGASVVFEDARSENRSGDRQFETERALFVVLDERRSDAELAATLSELSGERRPAKAVTYVVPGNALSAWPLPADPVIAGDRPPDTPAGRERELYLHEAIFLPSALRLAVGFSDAPARLTRINRAIERALRVYDAGWKDSLATLEETSAALFHSGARLLPALQDALLHFSDSRSAGR
ncbi:MAG: nucleotidyltransferase domain-containing protein [Elusimicrobia bacterium]|nr:nucleotidyltransferase domain-containing protein [Elusimicrobiota bacterium]